VGLINKIKSLASKPISLVVDLLGSGSTTKPLSEKITEMTGIVEGFGTTVTGLNPEIIVEASTARTAISDLTLDYENFTNTVNTTIPTLDIDISPAQASIGRLALDVLETEYNARMAGLAVAEAKMQESGTLGSMYGPPFDFYQDQMDELTTAYETEKAFIESKWPIPLEPVKIINNSWAEEIIREPEDKIEKMIIDRLSKTQKLIYNVETALKLIEDNLARIKASDPFEGPTYSPTSNFYPDTLMSEIEKQNEKQALSYGAGGGAGYLGFSGWRGFKSQFGSRRLGGTVPKTGLYLLHKSEKVISAPQAARDRRGGTTTTFGDIHIHIPASAAPQRPEDYRRITRSYIIPELEKAGRL
jgi:hypothetical protein